MSSILCLIFSLVFLLVTVLALLAAIRTTRAWRQVREAEQEQLTDGEKPSPWPTIQMVASWVFVAVAIAGLFHGYLIVTAILLAVFGGLTIFAAKRNDEEVI